MSAGTSAVLLEGARRIGKSTIVEEFAKQEYDDYMILDFAKQSKDIKNNYIETGSFISIKKNVQDILIPSEEYRIKMYPMDFEEYLWALEETSHMMQSKMLL